ARGPPCLYPRHVALSATAWACGPVQVACFLSAYSSSLSSLFSFGLFPFALIFFTTFFLGFSFPCLPFSFGFHFLHFFLLPFRCKSSDPSASRYCNIFAMYIPWSR
ncbi:hypothetical protein EGW08_016885, partial [Elysia chlorotica]